MKQRTPATRKKPAGKAPAKPAPHARKAMVMQAYGVAMPKGALALTVANVPALFSREDDARPLAASLSEVLGSCEVVPVRATFERV